jgi:hypothetical protein
MKSSEKKIEELRNQIECGNISKFARGTRAWGGADVIISGTLTNRIEIFMQSQPKVISFQQVTPGRRAVITKWYKELSWLFKKLRNIFVSDAKLDYISKYDFYGRLADSANKYISDSGDENLNELLLKVIEAANIWRKEQ